MKRIFAILIISIFSLTNIIFTATTSSAQGIMTIGEIRTTGNVFIESSNGQWNKAGATYPMIQNTAVRTEDGSASLYFRDGSRADLSKDTAALIDGTASNYNVYLTKGIMAVNINPSASMTVSTPSTTININSKNSIIQKVSYEKGGRVLGIISVTDKGTEVRSISGRMLVSVSAFEAKAVATGESMYVEADNKYKIYKTQTQLNEKTGPAGGGMGMIVGAVGAVLVNGPGLVIAFQNTKGSSDAKSIFASPSGFSRSLR